MSHRQIKAAALGICMLLLAAASVRLPLGDFAEYWAAGRLNAAGHNPYDPAAVFQEQRQVGTDQPRPVMMYNPPWTLAFAMPLGMVDIRLAHGLWLLAQVLICLWCASRTWELYGGTSRHAVRVWCLALLWMPTLSTIQMGQISPLILIGLVGFVCSLNKGRDVAAGLFFALTAVKPQLVALVWVAWVLWVLHQRRWKVLTGAASGLAAASLLAVSTNHSVFAQYWHLMASSPPMLEFESPNIATLLRVIMTAVLGTGGWPQFIPTSIGVALVIWRWRVRRQMWQWADQLPWLVTSSCLVTSYGGWSFDLLILLLPVIATAALVVRTDRRALVTVGAGLFLAVSFTASWMYLAGVPEALYLWITPVVALFSSRLERFARAMKTVEIVAV